MQENKTDKSLNVRDIRERYKSAYMRNGDVRNVGSQYYVYPYMRHNYNLELERLYDKNGMQFERKTYKMMPSMNA